MVCNLQYVFCIAGLGFVQRYAYGAPCGGSDATRRVAVKLTCGPAPTVTSVVEDGNCMYILSVSTPAACFKWPRTLAASHVAELKELLATVA